MNEPRSPQQQNPDSTPTQQQPTDPSGGSKPTDPKQGDPKNPPQKDPCDEPKPPCPEPPPEKPPCPPKSPPCPPHKPCPEPPKRPCPPPDPCAEEDPKDKPADTPTQSSPGGETPPDGNGSQSPTQQKLAKLKSTLEERQKDLQRLEPLKAEMADLTVRIQALEKTVDGQSAAATTYKDYYHAAEVLKSETDCVIPTVRCQLELSDRQKKCICEAIEAVDGRVAKAVGDGKQASDEVERLEKQYKRDSEKATWAKKWYEFLKTGMQAQVTKQSDDLKALRKLIDPVKDPCEVWFYLYEMERLLMSSYGSGEACWAADMKIGTYLDCWSWECYEQAWETAVVRYNDADATEKITKSQLEQAKKRAGELDKLAKEAESKRREWILKEIKSRECCGPLSKCP